MDIFTRAKMESKSSDQDAEIRSTISSSELLNTSQYPPYRSNEPTSLIVARLISRTLLTITLIVSVLVLFTVYIQNKNVKCDYGLKGRGPYFEPLTSESSETRSQEANGAGQFPISLRMSGKAGNILSASPNFTPGKDHVNCVIERKSANQIIASEPKNLSTPFGNITTDPRLIHLTGEKLIFDCHSGDEANREKEKEVIILTAAREPFDEDKSISEQQQQQQQQQQQSNNINTNNNDSDEEEKHISHEKETEDSTVGLVKRSKRSPSNTKQLSCSCTC